MNIQRSLWTLTAILMAVLMSVLAPRANAQVTTEVLWQRCLGGSDFETGYDLRETSDGGFICVGQGVSTDGDLTGNQGGMDMLVTKLNVDGTVDWRRVLGGSSSELGSTCLEASDGSFMVAGILGSDDAGVSGYHGGGDIWVLKLSPQGDIIWQYAYGGSNSEAGAGIRETADGGFVVNGTTLSDDGDVVGFHPGGGTQDEWLFKINASGVLQWSRALGGSGSDSGGRLIGTADGGFLSSFTYVQSGDGDVSNYHGEGDCWLVKLSANGEIEWSRTVGGSQREFGLDILELGNGDLMLLGMSRSSDGDIAQNRGGYDALLARISNDGDLLWERTYGGTQDDDLRSLFRTDDGGFLLSGSSQSSDGDVTENAGEADLWFVKVDANGTMLWQRSYGGAFDDFGLMFEAADDGYLFSGITHSSDGDVVGHHGDRDLWLLKIDGDGEILWQRCLGGPVEDWGYVKTRTADGGYVAFGYTDSNDGDVSGNHGGRDMWVVKLKVNEPVVPPECALYIPNAFSPDKSTKNDMHCLYGTDCIASMSFNIFDRWGNKVFQSADVNLCWDGNYKGQPLDPGVFVYHLSATMNNGETIERQGNISLLK